MKKKCPDGKYYCYTDKKCKDIPAGFKVVGPAGMLRKENGHSVDDKESKNGKNKGGKPTMSSDKIKESSSPLVKKILERIEKESLVEKKGCAHNHKGEECPIHGMKECPNEKVAAAEEVDIEEAVRVPAKTGCIYLVSFTMRGKYMMMKIFFPEVGAPSRAEVQAALDKVYPGCHLQRYDKTDYQPGEPLIQMGEETESTEVSDDGINKSLREWNC